MSKKVVFVTLVIAFFSLVLPSCIKEEAELDWPRWRGPNGDGISNETNWKPEALTGGPNILWKVNIGLGYPNVSIKNNRLYTSGLIKDGNFVFCLNAETGQEIWRFSFESSHECQSTVTIDGNYVYAINTEGVLLCLKARNGKLRWKKNLVADYDVVRPTYSFAGSPVVDGKLLILTANTSGLALNRRSGKIVWSSEKPPKKFTTFDPANTTGTDYSTPVLYTQEGKRCALLSSWKGLSSVDVETGNPLWLYEWKLDPSGMVPDPVIVDTRIYIAQGFTEQGEHVGFLIVIDSGKPRVYWENSNLWSTIATPVFVDGYIYGCDNLPNYSNPDRGYLRCLNAETGEVCWEEDLGHGFTLTAAAGKLIILTTRGMLHIAEATPSSYQEISSGDVLGGERKLIRFWSPPVLYRGKIFCRDWGGELFCIDVSK